MVLTVAEVLEHPEYKRLDWQWQFTPAQSGKVSVGKGRGRPYDIYYEVHGTGPVKLVWIMGLGAFCTAWKRQTKYFAIDRGTRYSCLIFDNRGMGKSSKPIHRYTTTSMATDVVELLHHLSWLARSPFPSQPSQRIHIIGVSMGGMVAQELALILPAHTITSLCLTSTCPRIINTAPFLETLSQRINMLLPQSTSIDDQIASVAHRLFSDSFLAEPDTEGVFATNFDRFKAGEVQKRLDKEAFNRWGFLMQAVAAGWHYKSQADLTRLAERVGRRRICVMHGDRDRMLSFRGGEVLREELDGDGQGSGEQEDGVEWRVWKGAGHVLCWEKEMEHNRVIEALVERCERLDDP